VIEVSGDDAEKFLQSIISNDIHLLSQPNSSLSAAFLIPKGRIMSEAIIHFNNTPENSFLLDIPSKLAPELLKMMKLIKLRSKVTINECDNLKIWSVISTQEDPKKTIETLIKENNITSISLDPRSHYLGIRLVSSSQPQIADSIESSVDDYKNFLTINGVAESSALFGQIPHECNLDILNSLNYHKGCFVGQELIARTQFKGIIRKRFFPVLLSKMTEKIKPFNLEEHISFDDHQTSILSRFSFLKNQEPIPQIQNLIKSEIVDTNSNTKIGTPIVFHKGLNVGIMEIRLGSLQKYIEEPETVVWPLKIESETNDQNSIQLQAVPFFPLWWPKNFDYSSGKPIDL